MVGTVAAVAGAQNRLRVCAGTPLYWRMLGSNAPALGLNPDLRVALRTAVGQRSAREPAGRDPCSSSFLCPPGAFTFCRRGSPPQVMLHRCLLRPLRVSRGNNGNVSHSSDGSPFLMGSISSSHPSSSAPMRDQRNARPLRATATPSPAERRKSQGGSLTILLILVAAGEAPR